jgi:DHA2 family multidrug resistance protein-like MFS transporter
MSVAMSPCGLRERLRGQQRGDVPGMSSLITIVCGIKELADGGSQVAPTAAIVVGAAIGFAFLRRQRVLPDPLLDVALFTRRQFSVSVGAQLTALFALGAFQFFLMQHLQLVLGLSPLTAGLWTLPGMLAGIVGALLGPVFTRTIAPSTVISAGLALAATGAAGAVWALQQEILPTIVAFVVMNLAINTVWALSYDQILSAAPTERAGTASGAAETGNELDIALGVALSGSLGAAVYHAAVSDSLPEGLSPADAGIATDNLAGAISVAERLPAEMANQVLGTARDAFTSGMQVITAVVALMLAAMAVAVAKTMRDRPGKPGPDQDGSREGRRAGRRGTARDGERDESAPEQPAR